MKLKPGQHAKNFSVKDFKGNPISLEDYRGKKLILSFYRYAACPLCNVRVHELIKRYPEFKKKGLNFLAFFESPRESIEKNVGKQDAPFPIIPDPERLIYKKYGVGSSWWGMIIGMLNLRVILKMFKYKYFVKKPEGDVRLLPADFLIDEKGVIRHAFYAKNISGHMPMSVIEEFLG